MGELGDDDAGSDEGEPSADPDGFDEALAWFRTRVPITDDELAILRERAHRQAFRVAGVAQLDLVTQVWEGIAAAIKGGETLSDFKARVADQLYNAWGGEQPYRVETIFRTNVQMAYSAGRYRVNTSQAVRRFRPYWRFVALLDSRTSKICRPLNGTVLPIDHPWWSTHNPPLHHSCRSTVMALTHDQAEAFGIDFETPDGGDGPAEGFGDPPDIGEWEPDWSEYPEPLLSVAKR